MPYKHKITLSMHAEKAGTRWSAYIAWVMAYTQATLDLSPELSTLLSFKPGVGQTMAVRALPAARLCLFTDVAASLSWTLGISATAHWQRHAIHRMKRLRVWSLKTLPPRHMGSHTPSSETYLHFWRMNAVRQAYHGWTSCPLSYAVHSNSLLFLPVSVCCDTARAKGGVVADVTVLWHSPSHGVVVDTFVTWV